MGRFWSLHTHTRESAKDALPSVRRTVKRAAELGYPALGITDHGTISGAVEFYKECRKANIEPLIGVEAYVAFDRNVGKRAKTMHSCIVAYNETGYRNLVRLVTLSNENYHFIPVLDLADLAEASERGGLEGLLMTSGCWFGLLPTLMRETYLTPLANVTKALSRWFDGHFYIEIQNHQVADEFHDDEAHCWVVHSFAVANNLPTLLTQDSHYIHPEDQKIHDAFKRLSSWNIEDLDSAIFPGDGYHMVDDLWMEEHHAPEIYERGMAGLDQILSMANLRIPELDEYNLVVPDTTVFGTPDEDLAHLVTETMKIWGIPKSKEKAYIQRLNDEIAVIKSSGFAGYLLLVRTVCEWMREQDIRYRVRGSATGSLVCWLLDITGYDPIKWNLSFDRFLSTDRTKPPDIDLDVEHERRHEVVDWLGERFYTVQIGTSLGYKIVGEGDETNGSLVIAFKKRQRALNLDPNLGVPEHWRRNLKAIAEYNGLSGKVPIDPPLNSVGQHAAGVLIAPDQKTLDNIPKRWISSSRTMVSAYDMDDVEALGLVKLDVLGLRTLTALRIAEKLAYVDAEEFPLNDRLTFQRISSGNTRGMFQLEGGATMYGVKRMRPKRISDVIAAMALFRPAAMDSGATESYLRRRNGAEEKPVRHELIEKHTSDTYGVLIYQEQALGILKDLGLTVEEIEIARKVIKASNANVGSAAKKLAELMGGIKAHARDAGMNGEDIKWLSDALDAYAGYSFNRAHATAYGILAYQTAYLAVHHSVAFWTGTLIANSDSTNTDRRGRRPEDLYVMACREDGVKVLPPHINRSLETYTTDGVRIYKGFGSIKGIGEVAAKELADKSPYSSLEDLALRVVPRKVSGAKDLLKGHSPESCPGVIRLLHEAGAFKDVPLKSEESK